MARLPSTQLEATSAQNAHATTEGLTVNAVASAVRANLRTTPAGYYVSASVGRSLHVFGPFESQDAAEEASFLCRPSDECTKWKATRRITSEQFYVGVAQT
jgi:hypothetical protein